MNIKKYKVRQQVSQVQFKKYISTDFLSANSDKTLLSCSVIMGVALIYFIFSKNKNNDGDNQSPPCPKKALDDECRALPKEVQEYSPNAEVSALLKPINYSGDYNKIPYEIPTTLIEMPKPLKTVSGQVYDWLVWFSEFF